MPIKMRRKAVSFPSQSPFSKASSPGYRIVNFGEAAQLAKAKQRSQSHTKETRA
jgi:hypothetical protein